MDLHYWEIYLDQTLTYVFTFVHFMTPTWHWKQQCYFFFISLEAVCKWEWRIKLCENWPFYQQIYKHVLLLSLVMLTHYSWQLLSLITMKLWLLKLMAKEGMWQGKYFSHAMYIVHTTFQNKHRASQCINISKIIISIFLLRSRLKNKSLSQNHGYEKQKSKNLLKYYICIEWPCI